ncbi:hypothetical protein [Amphibacillus xylanus]|uniref:Uncharacterized protein n=1 Tax=Amphibacillus xylanus (strain ATCC 51415 / DSM 6626 / JCM 7361 / LMG 17667 / NBRC 15112 / Ep01) TaxID=698758 RepID=K0IZG1_AMPXN|nr:hypothetical protein [Amphibacillus xylanus]BAM46357.1 hypothetical protein AXY_02250 [Amphibacillus xylanus NBRC 15112]
MNQDVNKIIDIVSSEWANQLLQANKKIGILSEQNERLQKEIEQLKQEIESKTEVKEEEK